jgi:hypothetical protein
VLVVTGESTEGDCEMGTGEEAAHEAECPASSKRKITFQPEEIHIDPYRRKCLCLIIR